MLNIRLLISICLLAAALLTPAATRADDSSMELGEVVVTGTRTERRSTEVPAAIDVVTREEVTQSQGWNVGEMLESLPGVQSQSKNGAYDTHIMIRGAGAKAAYGVREIMIMVDGVPITDPDSLSRLDVVDTSLIERIEVLKGPNSTLYGANAAGGVVNIITKDPLASRGFTLKTALGSYNSQNTNLFYGGEAGEKLSYILSASRRSTDSWRAHNEFHTNQLNLKVNYLPEGDSAIDLLMSYTKADLQLPSSLTREQFDSNPDQAGSDWPDCGRYSETARFTLGYEKTFTAGYELKGQLYVQDWEHYHPVPLGINDGGSQVYGAELQLNIPHRLGKSEHLLTAGFSGQRDNRDSRKFAYRDWNGSAPYTSSDTRGQLMSEEQNRVDKWGIYLQESLRPTENLLIDLGIRYDRVRFVLNEKEYLSWGYIFVPPPGSSYFGYKTERNTIDTAKTWTKLTPRIGANYRLNKEISLYATVGTAFQTPTQGELGTNSDLKPQETINYETGLKGRFSGGHRLNLALYYTVIDEEVVKLMDEDGLTYYDNAGETLHRGLELSGRLQVFPGVCLGGSYSYNDFIFKKFNEMEKRGPAVATHSRDGNRIQLVPVHQFSLFLDWRHSSGASARLSSDTWGKYFVDAANSESYPGFTVFKGRLAYSWDKADIFFQVDNIFDHRYAAEVSKSYGATRYSPAAPRTWNAGVNVRF